MEESATKSRSVADIQNRRVVSVEGYDTSLHPYYLELVLKKHFSSCGEIFDVYIPRDYESGLLKSPAFIFFRGEEGVVEKAVGLNGSDVDGWSVVVEPAPSQEEYMDPFSDAKMEFYKKERMMRVTGFDTKLPEDDIIIGLTKHFSSCGEVRAVKVFVEGSDGRKSSAIIIIMGEDVVVDKAKALSGLDVQGWNVVVEGFSRPSDSQREGFYRPSDSKRDRDFKWGYTPPSRKITTA